MGNAAKTNIVGRKLFFFFEAIEDRSDTEPLEPAEYLDLIDSYLNRFEDELEQIKIKQSIGKNHRQNSHASRESAIKMTLEKEVGDFNGGGLELPDLCDADEYKKFKDWDGDASKVQHIKVKFISRKSLLQESQMDDE